MKALLLKAGITLCVFVLLAYQIDLKSALSRLVELNPIIVILGLAIGLIQIFILAYRWMLVSRLINLELPISEVVRCSLACQFFNQGLPASVGGDVLRAWWLKKLGTSFSKSMQSILLDRVAGLISLAVLVMMAAGLLLLSKGTKTDVGDILQVAALVILIVFLGASKKIALILISMFRLLPMALQRNSVFKGLFRWALTLQKSCRQLVYSREGWVVLCWGILIHLSVVLLCYFLAYEAGIEVSLIQLFSIVPLVLLLSYLPISIGGWGVREGGMAAAFGLIGLSSQDGVFLGLSLGVIVFGSAVLGALVWVVSPMPVSLSGRIVNERS